MNRHTLLVSVAAIAAGLAFTQLAAAADAETAKPAKEAASKPAAKAAKAKPAAKPAAAKAAAKPADKTAKAPAAKAPAGKTLPAASPEQISAADRALKGEYTCDSDKKIHVVANEKSPGYLDMTSGKAKYTLKPSVTNTGTVKLEDVNGRVELLQIANKSMLMDVKAHTRLMDCVHPSQKS